MWTTGNFNHLKMRRGTSPDSAGSGPWGRGSALLQFQLLAFSHTEERAYLDCKVLLPQNALVPISFSWMDFRCLAGARRFKEEGLKATVGAVWSCLFSCSLSKHPPPSATVTFPGDFLWTCNAVQRPSNICSHSQLCTLRSVQVEPLEADWFHLKVAELFSLSFAFTGSKRT